MRSFGHVIVTQRVCVGIDSHQFLNELNHSEADQNTISLFSSLTSEHEMPREMEMHGF